MNRFVQITAAALLSMMLFGLSPARAQDRPFRRLFNGKNFAAWETFLGRPNKGTVFEGLKKDEKGNYVEAVGVNKDPTAVFSVVVVDGQPAVRVSGEVNGALTSLDEFENYHFRVEFKWGQKQWGSTPRARDSGLLYHGVGPHGANGYWLKSQELQIQEGDCGDYWSVADVALMDIPAAKKDVNGPWTYDKTSEKVAFGGRNKNGPYCKKGLNSEKKSGEWNVIELYCHGGTSVHVVNGKVTMVLYNSRHMVDGKETPLTKGKLQLQSEGAEVFYRKMAVRPIKGIPAGLLN